jgi:hypothetical protein
MSNSHKQFTKVVNALLCFGLLHLIISVRGMVIVSDFSEVQFLDRTAVLNLTRGLWIIFGGFVPFTGVILIACALTLRKHQRDTCN